MKMETLAKRIGEKTGEPCLEKLVLGQATAHDLPNHCIPWHGAMTGMDGLRQRVRRDYGNLAYPGFEFDHRRAVINFQNKRHYVARLLFEKVANPPDHYRLHQNCGRGNCVNPLHHEFQKIQHRGYEPFGDFEAPPAEPVYSEEWTEENVAEVVELALTENWPRNWAELMKLQIMEDAPEDLVAGYLESIGKPHLMPTA